MVSCSPHLNFNLLELEAFHPGQVTIHHLSGIRTSPQQGELTVGEGGEACLGRIQGINLPYVTLKSKTNINIHNSK